MIKTIKIIAQYWLTLLYN